MFTMPYSVNFETSKAILNMFGFRDFPCGPDELLGREFANNSPDAFMAFLIFVSTPNDPRYNKVRDGVEL